MQNEKDGLIVVGIDGSEEADEALRFAVDEARLRGAHLRVVTAWSFDYAEPDPSVIADMSARACATLEDSCQRVIETADGAPEVELRPVEGSPAAVLLRESEDADLVVVGSRGRGGFASLLLGSCSHQLVQHAELPVVVVRRRSAARTTTTG